MSAVLARVEEVEARLDGIERDLTTIVRALAAETGRIPGAPPSSPGAVVVEQDDANRPTKDEVWACARCGSRLALYNPDDDLLRIRYKDFTAHVRTGAGGVIRIVCRSCSEINEIAHADVRDPALPAPPPRRTR